MKLAHTFLPSLGKETIHLNNNALGLSESPYFSQVPKVVLDDIISPNGSTLLQYVDTLLLCSSSKFSQEDRLHLLELLAFKGHKISKEKLQFV